MKEVSKVERGAVDIVTGGGGINRKRKRNDSSRKRRVSCFV